MDKEFRIHKKGIGNDTRAGVPDGEKNDPGIEQPLDTPFPTRESHGRKTTERIHEWLGSFWSLDNRQRYISTRVSLR